MSSTSHVAHTWQLQHMSDALKDRYRELKQAQYPVQALAPWSAGSYDEQDPNSVSRRCELVLLGEVAEELYSLSDFKVGRSCRSTPD